VCDPQFGKAHCGPAFMTAHKACESRITLLLDPSRTFRRKAVLRCVHGASGASCYAQQHRGSAGAEDAHGVYPFEKPANDVFGLMCRGDEHREYRVIISDRDARPLENSCAQLRCVVHHATACS
jgi:hypothetical protein